MTIAQNSRDHVSRQVSGRGGGSRGIALILTLLLLTVMVAMTLAMVISVTSDTLITRYYRNFRSSFYAADSGVNIARQYMLSQIVAAIPTTFAVNVQPIPAGTETTAAAAVSTQYNGTTSINGGQAAASWPGKFQITGATLGAPTCTPSGGGGGGTCAAPTGSPTDYNYVYPYTLTAAGQALANEQQNMQDAGTFVVNVHVGPAAGNSTSFAAWGTFLNQYAQCSNPFAPGYLTGPFFTNDSWTLTNSGSYTFTGKLGSVSPTIGWNNSDGCYGSANTNQTGFSTNFQQGVNLGATAIPLPVNDFSQKEAVLDGLGNGSISTINSTTLNSYLKDINATAYPTGGASSGVFLPYYMTSGSPPVAMLGSAPVPPSSSAGCGGGIYVEGDAGVTIAPLAGSSTGRVYTIVQGGTTTLVTIDPATNSTTIAKGGTSKTITGVPQQCVTSPSSATMLYVNGNITSLSGPGQGLAAIQDGTAVTVTAANNVTVTGDILYKTEPVTTTQNQIVTGSIPACCNNTPADTLIPSNNHGQVLGIFTAVGDIQMNTSQTNLEIDGSLAMISQSGSGGWINTGGSINKVTVVGGRIANKAKVCNCNSRNIYFDVRFSQGGFAPLGSRRPPSHRPQATRLPR